MCFSICHCGAPQTPRVTATWASTSGRTEAEKCRESGEPLSDAHEAKLSVDRRFACAHCKPSGATRIDLRIRGPPSSGKYGKSLSLRRLTQELHPPSDQAGRCTRKRIKTSSPRKSNVSVLLGRGSHRTSDCWIRQGRRNRV